VRELQKNGAPGYLGRWQVHRAIAKGFGHCKSENPDFQILTCEIKQKMDTMVAVFCRHSRYPYNLALSLNQMA